MIDLVYNKNIDGAYFIQDYCKEFENYEVAQMFKAIIQCLLDIVPNFNLIEYLNNKNVEGKTCFDIIEGRREIKGRKKAVIIIWLQNLGYFFELKNGNIFLTTTEQENNKVDDSRGSLVETSQNNGFFKLHENLEISKDNEVICDNSSCVNENPMHSITSNKVGMSNQNSDSNKKVDQKIPGDVLIYSPVDDEIENRGCFCRLFCFLK